MLLGSLVRAMTLSFFFFDRHHIGKGAKILVCPIVAVDGAKVQLLAVAKLHHA
jgi:hypothetical protein